MLCKLRRKQVDRVRRMCAAPVYLPGNVRVFYFSPLAISSAFEVSLPTPPTA